MDPTAWPSGSQSSGGKPPKLKIITRQMPFQVLCLNQLKIFGSFAQKACSEGQLELLPGALRQAMDDLTKEMVSGRGHQVGEKRLWTRLPCGPGLAGEGLWASSNTFNLERIKELRVDPSAAAADILSLKHIFF